MSPTISKKEKNQASISPGVAILVVSSSIIQPAPHQVLVSKAKFYYLTKTTVSDRGKLSL